MRYYWLSLLYYKRYIYRLQAQPTIPIEVMGSNDFYYFNMVLDRSFPNDSKFGAYVLATYEKS